MPRKHRPDVLLLQFVIASVASVSAVHHHQPSCIMGSATTVSPRGSSSTGDNSSGNNHKAYSSSATAEITSDHHHHHHTLVSSALSIQENGGHGVLLPRKNAWLHRVNQRQARHHYSSNRCCQGGLFRTAVLAAESTRGSSSRRSTKRNGSMAPLWARVRGGAGTKVGGSLEGSAVNEGEEDETDRGVARIAVSSGNEGGS